MPRLTKRLLDTLPAMTRDTMVWDTAVPGFYARVQPSGRIQFGIRYTWHGRRTKHALGLFGILTVEQARELARNWLVDVQRGVDPRPRPKPEAVTVQDLAERYSKHHLPRKKASSQLSDALNMRKHVLPTLGDIPLADLTPTRVLAWHQSMHQTPGAANRCLALLSTMWSLAITWGLVPDGVNPCRRIPRYKEQRRNRYLRMDEVQRLGEVLAKAERERWFRLRVVDAVRLLLFTGARLGEILALQWEDIDEGRQCFWLRDSKVGPRPLYVSPYAMALAQAIPKTSTWVFPGATDGHHLKNFQRAWKTIQKHAGLQDVRVHDLRHTFASIGVQSGLSLSLIGGLLGHAQVATTQRYAHLAALPLHQAAAQIGEALVAALGPMYAPDGDTAPSPSPEDPDAHRIPPCFHA